MNNDWHAFWELHADSVASMLEHTLKRKPTNEEILFGVQDEYEDSTEVEENHLHDKCKDDQLTGDSACRH